MQNTINTIYNNSVLDLVFLKQVAIELIRVIFAAFIGLMTYRLYQGHLSKKDNSKLYTQMVQLEREFETNNKIVKEIIDMHDEYRSLGVLFGKNEDSGIQKLLGRLESLNNFVRQDIIYENGQPVDAEYVYSEKPYEVIEQLNHHKYELESEGERYPYQIHEIELEIENYYNLSIFQELREIESSLMILKDLKFQFEIESAFYSLDLMISEFNSLREEVKKERLDSFCKELLYGKNEISKLLMLFRKYNKLKKNTTKHLSPKVNKTVKLQNELWNRIEIELLIAYDPDTYLTIYDFYLNNYYSEIGKWDYELAKKVFGELRLLQEKIIGVKDSLSRTLKQTSFIFGRI